MQCYIWNMKSDFHSKGLVSCFFLTMKCLESYFGVAKFVPPSRRTSFSRTGILDFSHGHPSPNPANQEQSDSKRAYSIRT
jgi:hypothetical protein